MVLCGDFARGLAFVERAIATSEILGDALAAAMQRVYAAEILLELLSAREKPPMAILLKNLPFLIWVRFTGWRRAWEFLLRARAHHHFDRRGQFRLRIDTDQALLHAIGKRRGEARELLTAARIRATELQATALLRKIDAALATL